MKKHIEAKDRNAHPLSRLTSPLRHPPWSDSCPLPIVLHGPDLGFVAAPSQPPPYCPPCPSPSPSPFGLQAAASSPARGREGRGLLQHGREGHAGALQGGAWPLHRGFQRAVQQGGARPVQRVRFGLSSMQGWRTTMEDAVSCV
ncbi:hypothetical protein PVAP13_9NG112419 [Panicum virgatum]|uniref:Uncharacterized protein n=1 Tax=Panicum virgatum TaxID=38727 RepID=A0A8T0MKS3_PANVG|nr:hypothetical protein PVAP13_9NG112419 [Panicum virgatum]